MFRHALSSVTRRVTRGQVQSRFVASTVRAFSFISGGCIIPHPEKAEKGGEDAKCEHPIIIGVADGVGGWAEHGVDPSAFSRGLMTHSEQYVSQTAPEKLSGKGALHFALSNMRKTPASSTACVAILKPTTNQDSKEATVEVTNLGDSGYILFAADGSVKAASEPQTQGFNFPYQLCTTKGYEQFTPEDADVTELKVLSTDLLLLATDGVFDNVFPREMTAIIQSSTNNGNQSAYLHDIASKIANKAHLAGFDEQFDSPFTLDARKHGIHFPGGKLDDVCIVVASVQPTLGSKL